MTMLSIIFVVLFAIGLGVYLARRDDWSGNGDAECKEVEQSAKKNANKIQILEVLERSESGKITNNNIEALLGVSDATATRYMSELEAEGKVRQVGAVGKGVYYTLN